MNEPIFYSHLAEAIKPHMPEFDEACARILLKVLSPHMTYASQRQHASQFTRNRTPLTRREAALIRCGLREPETFVRILREAAAIHREYYGIKRNRDARDPAPPMPVYACA